MGQWTLAGAPLTCQTAYDVVESIDMERRNAGIRKKQYWSKKWITSKSGVLPDEDRTAGGDTYIHLVAFGVRSGQ